MPKVKDTENAVIAIGKADDVFAWIKRLSDRNPGMTVHAWLMMGR